MSEKRKGQVTKTSKIRVGLNESDKSIKKVKERALNILFKESNRLMNEIAVAKDARRNLKVDFLDPQTGELLSDFKIGSKSRNFNSFSTDAISSLERNINKDIKNSGHPIRPNSLFLPAKKKEIAYFTWDGDRTISFSLIGYKITDGLLHNILKNYNWGIAETKKERKKKSKTKNEKINLDNKLKKMKEIRSTLIDGVRKIKDNSKRENKTKALSRRFHFKGYISPKEIKTKKEEDLYKSRKVILDRLFNGEYGLSDSELGRYTDTTFDFRLAYNFIPTYPELDENNICGIDMGINIPVYCAIYNSSRRLELGDGKEIIDKRKQFDKQKARKRKIKEKHKTTSINKKELNWIDNYYHNISKKVIEFCLKNGCGTIHIEDLSQLRTKEMEKGGKRTVAWTPHKLKEMLKYKGDEYGIKVKEINPKYTSQRCYQCGYISKENVKDKYSEQRSFKCVNCGFEVHADYNGALNIATPKVNEKIKKEIERQKKESQKEEVGKEKQEVYNCFFN